MAIGLLIAGGWLAAERVEPGALFLTLGILALAALGLAPTLARSPFVAIAVPVLLAYAGARALVGGATLSEPGLALESLSVAALAWLVHRVFQTARSLEERDGALERAAPGSVLRLDDVQLDPAEQQFLLACRHDHPLSCIVVEADEASLSAQLAEVSRDTSRSFLESYALGWAAKVAADTTRRSDLTIAGDEPRKLVLLCPETTWKNAVRVARKIARALVSQLGLEVRLGVATFPDQALNLRELIGLAESSLVPPARLDDTGQMEMPFVDSEPPAGDLAIEAEPEVAPEGLGRLPAGGNIAWDPSVFSKPSASERAGWLAKRVFDLLVVCLFAPLWLSVFGLIAIAIKLTSPGGPVLFEQVRVGRWGRRFRMLKFRTMVPEAEELKSELRPHSEMPWPDFKLKEDPRITSVGRFLRRTSLDELPQLVNVLRGEMSLVGPRPTSFSDNTYTLWQKARLAVPPGLTGLWQINGRGSSDFEQRARMDISYIEQRSLFLDLWILYRTASVVLGRKGGY